MSLRRLLNVAYAALTEGMSPEAREAYDRHLAGEDASPKQSRQKQQSLMSAMGLARP